MRGLMSTPFEQQRVETYKGTGLEKLREQAYHGLPSLLADEGLRRTLDRCGLRVNTFLALDTQ